MMIRDFDYYLAHNLAKRSETSPPAAKAMIAKAELRLKRLNAEEIKDEMASIMFEEAYEAMREASQAIMQLKGFKPYSHEALIAFIVKENLFSEQFPKSLDRYRILRNRSVYEAQKISMETLKEALEFARTYIPEVKKTLSRLILP